MKWHQNLIKKKFGTPSLAKLTELHQAWIVRIESGEYKRLDMARVYRIARALSRSMREMLA